MLVHLTTIMQIDLAGRVIIDPGSRSRKIAHIKETGGIDGKIYCYRESKERAAYLS